MPDNISDDELLGTYFSPKNLSLADDTGKLNVNNLNEYSLGQAPTGTGIEELIKWGTLFLISHSSSEHKWLWAYLVGKLILEPYGLRAEGKHWWSSSKKFSLSLNYAKENFPQDAPSTDDFFFVRSGRPFLIMNDNIMEKKTSNIGNCSAVGFDS
ncbi:MAG: hypothetical protein QM487_08840 [Candidatus Marithrix sp.]